jgi:glycosyltransferase involved in cell wall biosynthesis
MHPPAISVVIPAYDEASRIAQTIATVREELDRRGQPWELVIVDDGSRDGTAGVVEAAAAGDPRIRLIRAAHAGKGAAVRRGMLAATGQWRYLADADLSTPIAQLDRFVGAAGSADIVIGSREAAGAVRLREPWRRHAIGRLFNWVVKLLVLRGIEDTQCGFKLFRGAAAEALFPLQTLNGFGFDVEILFLARRAGMRVRQVPVTWTYGSDTKVTPWSGLNGFVDLLRIRWNGLTGRYDDAPAALAAAEPASRLWRLATWAVAAIMCAAVCVSLLRIPVQTTDSIVPLLQAEETPGVLAAIKGSFASTAYLRPLRIGQIQFLYELAKTRDQYFLVFRGFHAALVIAAFALFVGALRVRTRDDFFAATFALTVLTGLHTFLGTVWEAYPINHFLEVVVFCLLALVLAQSRGGWWVDAAAAGVFLVASLTLESGLLVWVVLVAARISGLRGVSWSGVLVVTVLLVVYMYVRFETLGTGAPALTERSSGFWTGRLDPDELVRRFGDQPYIFYAYNVASSWMSVAFAEPRAGTFGIPRQLGSAGAIMPGTLLNVVSSVATTGLMLAAALRHRREWLRGRFTRNDQLLLVALAVIAANGLISYGYTKDETMSTAGAFYALATFAAVRDVADWAGARRALVRVAIAGLLLLTACAWSVRTVGLHYHMRRIAYMATNEWVSIDRWLDEQGTRPQTPEARRLVDVLRADALDRRAGATYFLPPWAERWFQ